MEKKPIVLGVQNLILEVTRRCNLECEHCLRGDSEDKEMRLGTIRRVFETKGRHRLLIQSLTITGGEPLLALFALRRIATAIRENSVTVREVWIATNCLIATDEIIAALKDLCEVCNFEPRWSVGYDGKLHEWREGDEFVGLAIAPSLDVYHTHSATDAMSEDKYKQTVARNVTRLSMVGTIVKSKDRGIYNTFDVVGRGRAEGWSEAFNPTPHTEIWWDYKEEDFSDRITAGDVYVNVNGQILGDCDLSYSDQESLGTVDSVEDSTLIDVAFNHFESEEDEEYEECI